MQGPDGKYGPVYYTVSFKLYLIFHVRLGYLNHNSGDKAEMENSVFGGTRTVQL